MSQARCLCGDVVWEADGPLQFTSHCHCSRCRKSHGSAFATGGGVPVERFRFVSGERVTRWEGRCFCGRCGSSVPGDPFEGLAFVPLGNFDGDGGAAPVAHIFVASRAPWYAITDSLAQFAAYPKNIDAPVLPDRPPLDPPGKPRGSCLCGQVTYVIEGALLRCHNCHCGRCRRARSAAYATNLFTTADGIRFTRGEELLASFKLPDAARFTQIFCRVCGSPMPRVNPSTNSAYVPMGSLDDDPGMRPQSHIFVASKAPWFEITDDLPQHAEYPPAT